MAELNLLVDGVVIKKYPIAGDALNIGRHADNDIQIDDRAVSGHHAVIEVLQSPYLEGALEYFIRDLDSTNGTHVNASQVKRQRLHGDDVIRIGFNTFKFVDATTPNFEKTAYVLPDRDS